MSIKGKHEHEYKTYYGKSSLCEICGLERVYIEIIEGFIKDLEFKIVQMGIIKKNTTIMNLRLYRNEVINKYKKMLKWC